MMNCETPTFLYSIMAEAISFADPTREMAGVAPWEKMKK